MSVRCTDDGLHAFRSSPHDRNASSQQLRYMGIALFHRASFCRVSRPSLSIHNVLNIPTAFAVDLHLSPNVLRHSDIVTNGPRMRPFTNWTLRTPEPAAVHSPVLPVSSSTRPHHRSYTDLVMSHEKRPAPPASSLTEELLSHVKRKTAEMSEDEANGTGDALPEKCAEVYNLVNAFLHRPPRGDENVKRLEHARRQTRLSLDIIKEALERYR